MFSLKRTMRTIVYAIWHAVGRDRSRSLHQEARPTFLFLNEKEKKREFARPNLSFRLIKSLLVVRFPFLSFSWKRKRERTDQQFFFFNKNLIFILKEKRMWSVIRSLMKAMASQCPSEDDRFHPFLVLAWKPMRLWAHTRKEKTLRQRSPLQRLTILSLGVFY